MADPSWSPDAQELVFTNDQEGSQDIWYVRVDGSGVERLTTDDGSERQPEWNPAPGSRQVIYTASDSVGAASQIFTMTVSSEAAATDVAELTSSRHISSSPAWNANGTQIVYISDVQGDPDVYTMDPDGGGRELVTRDDNDAEDRAPQFSPNGAFIAFISNRLDDRFQTYLVSVDGEILTRLTETERNDRQLSYEPVLIFRLQ